MGFFRHFGEEAVAVKRHFVVQAHCNREEHRGWWVLATGARRNYDLRRNDTRSEERLDGEAAWRSRAAGAGPRKHTEREERL